MKARTQPILILAILLAFAGGGLLAWAAWNWTRPRVVTAEEVVQYVNSADLSRMSGAERRVALLKLEEDVNALTLEERRRWWLSGEWHRWFDKMTEAEKGDYIDATLPTGFKQVLNAFEKLPDGQRWRAIDDAMHQIKATHRLVTDHEPGHPEGMYGTNPPPVLSVELENRARMVGFRTFYVESSAQTKAELAPLVEELQHQLETSGKSGQ